MTVRETQEFRELVEALGPAEKLLNLILNFPDHLWHNRPGVYVDGRWRAATRDEIEFHKSHGRLRDGGEFRAPGPNPEAIEKVYSTLAEIYEANNELAARLASYVMTATDWKDMKVVCAAFMLVQNRSGQPVFSEEDDGKQLLFHDEDYREIGEAMIKTYRRGSNRMMNPKMIQRIGVVLALPGVVEMNKTLGFGNPQKRKAFTGRYYNAVRDWLRQREMNLPLLEGLRKAGFGRTVRSLARMTGYKPETQRFFEILGWRQKQHRDGHRTIGLAGLNLERLSFAGLNEEQICKKIVDEGLRYKQVVGLLPREIGLTPAVFVAAMASLSDKDLVILTPTLEELGLLNHPAVKERWRTALASMEDQRARNIARNLKNRADAAAMQDAADRSLERTVAAATTEADLYIMFLIDKSGSMEGAIEKSREVLANLLQGFDLERLHIACFDNMGTYLKLRHASRAGVQNLLGSIRASGGTSHSAGIAAMAYNKVRIPAGADLVVFVVGDEDGEDGEVFARHIGDYGYRPAAFAHIVNVAQGWPRGRTVQTAARVLGVPYSEVQVEQFADAYQIQRTLRAILEARPAGPGRTVLIEKIMQTELLRKPY